ncbi:MAG: PTS sugar transporter subunit IIA [Planctomycetota bacterium]
MKFSDFIVYSAIQADLVATDKPGAIREMFAAIASAGGFPAAALPGCFASAMKREELGTSGIGSGVALPMTACTEIEHSVASIFLSQRGLDFEALDGEPVHLFFAIVKQPKDPKYYLHMMEYLSRAMKLEAKWSRLQQCRSRYDIIDWLDAVDTVLAG